MISDFYMTSKIFMPKNAGQREFGVIVNNNWVRHRTFTDPEKLRGFILETNPDGVFYSAAQYKYPDLYPMSAKKKYWIGSDLIFDIDFDHLPVQTLNEARKMSLKLINIMQEEFGLKEILYKSSGNRGYHIHIEDECVQNLTTEDRREIADFLQQYRIPEKGKQRLLNPYFVGIDSQVTIDMVRMIRLPETLNIKRNKENKIIHKGLCKKLELPKSNDLRSEE